MDKIKIMYVSVASFCLMSSANVLASAFQSFEQNASDLGTAYSGIAAIADDASTEFSNPAGMTRLKKPTIALSTILVGAHSKFTATSATNNDGDNILSTAASPRDYPLGVNPLPAIHAVMPMGDQWAAGFGIVVPFGLETDYSKNNAARYFATVSSIKTFDFTPSLAYAINSMISVGVGADIEYLEAELDQQVDFGDVLREQYSTNRIYDGTIENKAHKWGYGGHAGILFQFPTQTRLGITYYSPIYYTHIDGKTKVTIPTILESQRSYLESFGFKDTDFSTGMILPETITVSGVQQFLSRWNLLASVSYTHWARFQDLTIRFNDQLPETSIKEAFHDTFRYALGLNYQWNPHWLFRLGAAYDHAPTNNTWRTVRLPDADRIWWACGFRYNINKHFMLDAGYAYIHIKGGRVYQDGPYNSSIAGEYDHNYAHLLGAQLNWQFS